MILDGIPRFSLDQADALGRYVHDLAEHMGLRDWTITLSDDPLTRDEAIAACHPCPGRKLATLRLCNDFFTAYSADRQRQAIAHELVHCHLDALDTVIWGVEKVLAPGEWSMFRYLHTQSIEWATDAISEAWARTLPLPCFQEASHAP